ncbi:PucR family transcriptional regulator [Romboutsia sp.]|uniref:PucR family transcriptional regulator n=1 Tax=Romboutsia sp. TaxID=1965302 RepID=UPI002BD854E1|nr:helix-turn-helix domain-containing protein [Romboutsia sp.]HSQ87874.1 helix-turn-helix domain-containing protein [Romboutsia sp.]
MQNLIEFFEKETNKKISIFEYSNQNLKSDQKVVNFNNKTYIIEMKDRFVFDNINGHFYLIHQQNLEFDNLKRVVYNLYEDIDIFEYNQYIILNSNDVLDIDCSTPGVIESETYSNTYIAYLGKINDMDIFNFRLSILDEILPLLNIDTSLSKFMTLHDLTMYKAISLIGKEKSFCNLIDFESIKNIDENLLHTGVSFIENDLNISKTSSSLFLHRNTLIYRLEKIKELLGLDLKSFKDSFVFYLSIKSHFTSKL